MGKSLAETRLVEVVEASRSAPPVKTTNG